MNPSDYQTYRQQLGLNIQGPFSANRKIPKRRFVRLHEYIPLFLIVFIYTVYVIAMVIFLS